jgi:hypothetical protein
VLDGENGFVVDGRAEAQIADRIATLLLDRDLAAQFGKRGRQWVAENWLWDHQGDRLRAPCSPAPTRTAFLVTTTEGAVASHLGDRPFG